MNLSKYIIAGFPFLFVGSLEIKRAVNSITVNENHNLIKWDLLTGVSGAIDNPDEKGDPASVINWIVKNCENKTLAILENYDVFFSAVDVIQTLLNNMMYLKNKQICLCMVGTSIKFPKQLEKLVTVIDFPLPSVDEFKATAQDLCEQLNIEFDAEAKKAAENCAGLSLEEGEDAISLSLTQNRKLETKFILDMKESMIRKSGFLEFFTPEPIENVGGLENAKDDFYRRIEAYKPDSIKPKMKAVFLFGIPGGGKTLIAKALASIFNVPGLILNWGALKSKYVGESEENTRYVIKIIDAFGPCVVVIDEVEKQFSGTSGDTDSGVSMGMLGQFLTWRQETTSDAIVVVTANKVNLLPPEFMRAERWDQVFFVDFPNKTERKAIVEIMNRKHKANLPTDDKFINSLEGWTGAEISQLAKDSHFYSIEEAMEYVPVLSKFKPNEIKLIKSYAKGVRIANRKDEVETKRTRTISDDDMDLTNLKKNIGKKILDRKE